VPSAFRCVASVGGSVVSVRRWRSTRRPRIDPSPRLGVAFVGGVAVGLVVDFWFGGGGWRNRPAIPCADYPGCPPYHFRRNARDWW